MKKVFFFSSIAVMLIIACQQAPKVVPVDIIAEEAALNGLMDKLDTAFTAGDNAMFVSSLTDEALLCGTDPSEFWNKQQILEQLKQDSVSAAPEYKYISDRVTKVSPDGNSAIVVTQVISPWSPKIPVRIVYHFVKTNDKWMIQFINWAFVAKNEDIKKLNEAIE